MGAVPRRAVESETLTAGWAVLKRSRYLVLMLGLIAVVQLTVNLIDYQYNVVLREAYPVDDVRAAVDANVHWVINATAFGLQALAGPILGWMGARAVLLLIPALLAGAVATFAVAPGFLTMAVAKVGSKAMDYSLFRVGKEILYLPLSHEEKTRGKAFVDMMTYRLAKAGVSALLKVVPAALSLTGLVLGFIGGWLALTVAITRRWQEKRADVV